MRWNLARPNPGEDDAASRGYRRCAADIQGSGSLPWVRYNHGAFHCKVAGALTKHCLRLSEPCAAKPAFCGVGMRFRKSAFSGYWQPDSGCSK
mmetsp:Transcript_15601/g.36818  ORF Transcript_15601/g.36818 Transcript_15601/m.36818 type:complete len:93 (+) Transcript_15601:33-311(+)